MRNYLIIAAALAALSTMTACDDGNPDSGVNAEPKTTDLEKAYDACDPGSVVELADGNRSILVNGAQDDEVNDIACLMIQLDTPQYIIAEMDNTTALMGRQHEEDDNVTYDWSYHPDNGFDLVIHEG